jgi:plastocyanin
VIVRRAASIALVVLLVGAVGCGGSSSKKSSSSTAAGSPPAAAPGAISMKGLRFHPASATVRVGQQVTWTNDDNVDHNVTSTSGAKFMSRAFGHARTFAFTPRKPGTVKYVCTLHPGMTGKLVVTR